MSAKKKLLETLYSALYYSGASSIYSRLSNHESAVALMYHSVSSQKDRDWIDPDNDIPMGLFEEQMQFLRKNCNVVSIDHLHDCIVNHRPINPRTVVITFDDGYRNNLLNAIPILKKYNMPAIIYLTTGYVQKGEPQWIDELYSCFRHRKVDCLELNGFGRFDLSKKVAENHVYGMLKQRLKKLAKNERRPLLAQIKSQLRSASISERLTINWEDLNGIIQDYPNLALGVHTQNHADLTRLDPSDVLAEVENGMLDLEINLGTKAEHFSYPYGRWNKQVRNQIEKIGLLSAITSDPVPMITANSDIFTLPRIEAPRNMALFKYLVSGAYPRLSQLIFNRPKAVAPEFQRY